MTNLVAPRLSTAPDESTRERMSHPVVSAPPRRSSLLWRYWPLAIPVIGLAELALHLYFARRAPRPDEWADVRPAVAAWYVPGEVVVVAPYWAEPVARWKWGDALMPLRDVARADASHYDKAIEVSALGQRSPELAGWTVLRASKHGRFVLRELQNPAPAHPTYDFTDHVLPGQAEVRVEQAASATRCAFTASAAVESGGLGSPPTYPASRFVCPGQPTHVFVGLTIIEDGTFRPRRCIWSHPPSGGGALITRFTAAPLGGAIHGHAGMGYVSEREKGYPRFTIVVTVDGAEIGRVVHADGEIWTGFDLPLGPHGHRTGDVEFRVTGPLGGTHVCFEADSR